MSSLVQSAGKTVRTIEWVHDPLEQSSCQKITPTRAVADGTSQKEPLCVVSMLSKSTGLRVTCEAPLISSRGTPSLLHNMSTCPFWWRRHHLSFLLIYRTTYLLWCIDKLRSAKHLSSITPICPTQSSYMLILPTTTGCSFPSEWKTN